MSHPRHVLRLVISFEQRADGLEPEAHLEVCRHNAAGLDVPAIQAALAPRVAELAADVATAVGVEALPAVPAVLMHPTATLVKLDRTRTGRA